MLLLLSKFMTMNLSKRFVPWQNFYPKNNFRGASFSTGAYFRSPLIFEGAQIPPFLASIA
jgi:hypothetical protein